RRLTSRFDDHHRVGKRKLKIRRVELRTSAAVRAVYGLILHVADNAEARARGGGTGEGPGGAAEPHTLPERTFSGPEASCSAFADHRHRRRIRAILREHSASSQ